MQTDPDGYGENLEPGEPAAGTPPADPSELERVKRENAAYREQLRQESAKRLAAEHGLSTTQAELLALVPRDHQEEKAKALAEERAEATPAGTEPPAPPAQEGPEHQAAAAMQQMGTPPEPAAPAKSQDEQMLEEINNAKSYKELVAIQEKYRQQG